jgi:precorrin-2 dehydrogenase / sirohydrochlorin ferrochelatase
MKPYYPIYLDLTDVLCIVIGGGTVAERKIRGLMKARAKVRLISPKVTANIDSLGEEGRIEVIPREYRLGDLEGAALAFAATDDEAVNRLVKGEAVRRGVPVNIADNPDLCGFVVPSVVRRGPILVALSTSGLLPGLSKRLKKEIAEHVLDDYPAYARQVGRFRRFVIREIKDGPTRRQIMDAVESAEISKVARMTMKDMKERFLRIGGISDDQARAVDSPHSARSLERNAASPEKT